MDLYKNICCSSEIQIRMSVPYFYLLRLATLLHADPFLSGLNVLTLAFGMFPEAFGRMHCGIEFLFESVAPATCPLILGLGNWSWTFLFHVLLCALLSLVLTPGLSESQMRGTKGSMGSLRRGLSTCHALVFV